MEVGLSSFLWGQRLLCGPTLCLLHLPVCRASPHSELASFFFKRYFLVFFLAMLGLRCCAQAFSSCGEQGLLFVMVHTFPLVWLLCCRAGALGSSLRSSAAWA